MTEKPSQETLDYIDRELRASGTELGNKTADIVKEYYRRLDKEKEA